MYARLRLTPLLWELHQRLHHSHRSSGYNYVINFTFNNCKEATSLPCVVIVGTRMTDQTKDQRISMVLPFSFLVVEEKTKCKRMTAIGPIWTWLVTEEETRCCSLALACYYGARTAATRCSYHVISVCSTHQSSLSGQVCTHWKSDWTDRPKVYIQAGIFLVIYWFTQGVSRNSKFLHIWHT